VLEDSLLEAYPMVLARVQFSEIIALSHIRQWHWSIL